MSDSSFARSRSRSFSRSISCVLNALAVLILLPAAPLPSSAAQPKAASKAGTPSSTRPAIDFARDILPILSDKCFVCHGPDTQKESALRLDSYEGATADRGGYRAIDPAALDKSEILARIRDREDPMPPKDAEKQLEDAERELLSDWVRQGGRYALHWAFVPPHKTRPRSAAGDFSGEIDAFVMDALKERGLRFAPEADPATLARRAALVLTGLPPEPDLLETYLAEEKVSGSAAYERFVDGLLASPRYGEHQARYWLDAVRYGDTHGLHLDNRRGIYPYRDWVVRAFNQNLPLNDFITWQLAGDLLPDPTLDQRVATGYVRLNPTTAEGGVLPEEFQAKNNFDRTETLGTVFLGMTLSCARCHTHKYDPITQTEYYRLLAFFNSTAESSLDGNAYVYAPVLKVPDNQADWARWMELESEQDELLEMASAVVQGARVAVATATGSSTDPPPSFPFPDWEDASRLDRIARLNDPKGPFCELPIFDRAQELNRRVTNAMASFTTSLVAEELDKPRATKLLRRGEYDLPAGDPLEPGTPKVMGPFPDDAPANRLGLAQWLTSPHHPLASRVLVNRVWQSVFGEGLVRSPEDFGLQGQYPTHPGLLDWLAVELRERGWDMKHMLRLMVTSRVFRQSSAWRKDIDDPENRLLARGPGYRLDAEVLRDIGLWASGLLDPQMGGEGVKPYQPDGMWLAMAHPSSNTKKYVRDQGAKLYRRSLYVYWKRTSPHPMMTLFDAPSRESSCVRRSRTSTASQSLGLLNETQRIEMARKLAERLVREADTDAARLDRVFLWLTCRPPSPAERAACDRLVRTMRNQFSSEPANAFALLQTGDAARDEQLDAAEVAAWTQLAATVLASDAAILLY